MEAINTQFTIMKSEVLVSERTAKRRSRRCRTLGIACFVIGFSLPILGLVVIIAHVAAGGVTVLDRIGSVLMILSIPVLLTGSHLLDLSEK